LIGEWKEREEGIPRAGGWSRWLLQHGWWHAGQDGDGVDGKEFNSGTYKPTPFGPC